MRFRALIPQLQVAEVESLVIGFLQAYANPAHEERVTAAASQGPLAPAPFNLVPNPAD